MIHAVEVAGIDRDSQAIAFHEVLFIDRRDLESILARAPEVRNDHVVSWSNVTPEEFESMFVRSDYVTEEDARREARARLTSAPKNIFISAYFSA